MIRNENVRRTEVAKMSGLYIYRESVIVYDGNIKLCEKVLGVISSNKNYSMFKPQLFVKLLRNIDDDIIRVLGKRSETMHLNSAS